MRLWLTMVFAAALFIAGGCRQEQKSASGEEGDVARTADRTEAEADQDRGPGHEAPRSDQEKIMNALSAAPEAVADEATIIVVEDDGQIRTLREGTGAFTCMADNPMSPGNDPMCLDRNGMAWAQAWMSHTDPPAGKIGFGYMLQGGSDASNTDPWAQGPGSGGTWIDTGPHVMILNAATMMEGYPDQPGDPTKPFVMWPGTPYAHLMVPVE